MQTTNLIHVVTGLLVLTLAAQASPGGEPDRITPVKELLVAALESNAIPGMGAVVTDSQGILEVHVVGERIAGQGVALQQADPFHIGSVAKTMTATVIARLIEAGHLKWDSKIADLLPEVAESAHDAYTDITLAHLLSHEAGMRPMEELSEMQQVPPLTGDIQTKRRQFAEWVLRQEPIVPPTLEYRYSNAHFVVAASMAEAATGKSWEHLVRDYVFESADMQNAGFGWAGKRGENVPWGHRMVDGSLEPVDPNGDYKLPQYLAPAGDIHASLPDMAGYLQGYLASWNGSSSLIDNATLEKMWTRRLRSGLGWGVTSAFDYELVAMYTGSADTFFMVVVAIPEADLGIAIATNVSHEGVPQAVVETLKGVVQIYAVK